METFLPLLIILFLVIFPLFARRKRAAAVRQFLDRKKQNKESNEMKELAKRLIGKDCIIYTTGLIHPYGVVIAMVPRNRCRLVLGCCFGKDIPFFFIAFDMLLDFL